MIGRKVRYSLNGQVVEGVCIAVQRTGTTILDTRTGEERLGVRFQLRTDDGRILWTVTYPERL